MPSLCTIMTSLTTTLLGALLVPAAPALAAGVDFIYVPGDYPSIQDGIDAAVDGNEVIVAPGTYYEQIDTLGKAITLRASDPDPALTVIDGSVGGTGPVISIVSGEGLDTVIEGFTIANGRAFFGGGADLADTSPTIQECVFEANESIFSGGAIYATGTGATPQIRDCAFRNNVAATSGGALQIYCDALIIGCDFQDNEAGSGGAIQIGNTANDVRIVACRFRHNDTTGEGGALYFSGDATVVNCLARDNGGETAVKVFGDVTFVNCTFVQQDAPINVEVSGNTHVTVIANSILRGNAPDDLVVSGNGEAIVTYSNIDGGYPGAGNIDEAAGFVDPNGGDFHLGEGSPCVDAGRNGAIPPQVTTDLDGLVRFINDPYAADTGGGNGPIVDMGAYERLPEVRYVVADASGANTGHTWLDAYADLQDALDEARAEDVREVWVAADTYYPDRGTDDRTLAFEMVSGVEIVGGFAGDEMERDAYDPQANPTILSGAIGANERADNSYNVVRAIDVDGDGKLIGFRVEHGSASGFGGGVYVEEGGPVIRECVVRQNEASLAGAGIYARNSDVEVHRCRIAQNSTLR